MKFFVRINFKPKIAFSLHQSDYKIAILKLLKILTRFFPFPIPERNSYKLNGGEALPADKARSLKKLGISSFPSNVGWEGDHSRKTN